MVYNLLKFPLRVLSYFLLFLSIPHELVSTETIRGGALNEVFYTVRLKKGTAPGELVSALQARTSGQRVTVLTGYD
ncbi:hypothetical protein, partial [Bacillus cereus]|uniref:hypothetical protein n=1 Tax=Bacillus cereus TaxID=1396 RepID=UPI0036650BFF